MAYGSFNAGPGKRRMKMLSALTRSAYRAAWQRWMRMVSCLNRSVRRWTHHDQGSRPTRRISAAVDAHNGAENAHSDIRASVAAMNASIKAIELKFGTNVTKNPFSATFGSLDGLTVTGAWNAEQARWSSDDG
mgnify:CR=1 FL=1